jgi:hypothetical protein
MGTRLTTACSAVRGIWQRVQEAYDAITANQVALAYAHEAFLSNHFIFEENTMEYLDALVANIETYQGTMHGGQVIQTSPPVQPQTAGIQQVDPSPAQAAGIQPVSQMVNIPQQNIAAQNVSRSEPQAFASTSRNYIERSISAGFGERNFVQGINFRGETTMTEELMPEGFFWDKYPIVSAHTN